MINEHIADTAITVFLVLCAIITMAMVIAI